MQRNSGLRRVALVAALLVAMLWIPVLFRHEREAKKQQQIFDAWVRRGVSTARWDDMPSGLGPWAVPLIAKRVHANNSLEQSIYRKVWPKLPKAFHSHLPSPKPLIMEPNRETLTMFQLMCANPEGARLLVKELHNRNPDVRAAAILTLGDFVGKTISTNDAVRAFPPLLRDENPFVLLYTTVALGNLGAAASNAVPFMIPLLNGNETDTNGWTYFLRVNTVMILAKIGPSASNAVPQLKSLMTNGNNFQRLAAAFALWRIASNVSETLPVFIKDMAGYDRRSGFFPATALLEMGPRAQAAYPALVAEWGKRHDGLNEQTIAAALKAIDPEAAARDGIK
jgi:hypothetical protein